MVTVPWSSGRVIELTVADVDARVEERDGVPVIVTEPPVKPLTVDDVRAAVQRTRR